MEKLTIKERILIQHALNLFINENNREYEALLEHCGIFNLSKKTKDFYYKENEILYNLIKKIGGKNGNN